ncbi:homoserine kinase [Hesseltinella vesiculosa]|uniref:Homoserine kinase n=1 Tax=Hesseltinella vesiculosa TaxID=101127 RepID=A0A1X2GLY3_9FUNG|nr:homoserine kinase [Hesseltinella vesiculosa]
MATSSQRHFTIRVPCSSANIGPGYDTLGMSLSMYLKLDVHVGEGATDKLFEMTYAGEGATDVPLTPEHNLITKAALYVLSANGIQQLPSPLKIHVDNPIPLGRGLGSSGAAVVAGILLGDALGQLHLPKERLLDYSLMIERHPDNVAAALIGGFVASYLRELSPEDMKGIPESESFLDVIPNKVSPQPPVGIAHHIRLNWNKDIKCIAIVPQFKVATVEARAVVPTTFDRQDMIFNFQRLSVLTSAVGQSPLNPDLIYNAMQDKVHQPYRKTLIPGLPEILSSITLDKYDGLLGICLSGAGPTILALATHNFDTIAAAVQDLFKKHGIQDSFYKVLELHRWILFELEQDPVISSQTNTPTDSKIPLDVSDADIVHAMRAAMATTYGDFGSGILKSLQLKWFNPDTRTGILRAPRDPVDMVLSSLFFIKKVGSAACHFRCLQSSGTLIHIQKYAIERDQRLYLEEQDRVEKQGKVLGVIEKIQKSTALINAIA